MSFYNLARMYTTTTGTGTVTLTTAVPGCLTFALAGVADGATVNYGIVTYDTVTHRPTHSEVGTGVYTLSGLTLTRAAVEKSTNSNSAITLTGLSEVYLCPLASDFAGFGGGGSGVSFASYYNQFVIDTVAAGATTAPLTIDTETIDANNIASLSGNIVTVAGSGYYLVSMALNVISSLAVTANGSMLILVTTTGGNFYTRIPVLNGTNYTDHVVYVQGLVSLGAGGTVQASFANATNKNHDVIVYELTLLKLS